MESIGLTWSYPVGANIGSERPEVRGIAGLLVDAFEIPDPVLGAPIAVGGS